MNIYEYIEKAYNNQRLWFVDEVDKTENVHRVTDVINNKYYLHGTHKILQREDFKFKEKQYITKKLILQNARTILNFHSTYLLGKPLSLVGSENKVKAYQDIYRKGNYSNIDFSILDTVNKYGDAYEYIYLDDNKNIVSKLILPEDGYPVITESNEYVGFIENWTINAISYYNIYYPDHVEQWTNDEANGEFYKYNESINLSGLPIHWHNNSDWDSNFGRSLLDDIIPILDEIEDLLSKMGDGVYCLSLSPIPVVTGQEIQGNVSADAVGYNLQLENGSTFNFANAQMDYNTIKLYLDTLQKNLNDIAHMPSIITGNTNVANVSEVSLKLLYQLADIMGMLNEQWVRVGLRERFNVFDKLLAIKGIAFNDTDYVDVEFNYSRPINSQEILQNLQIQFNMGAISKQTIIEKSPLTNDVSTELKRIKKEDKEKQKNNPINNNDNNNMNNNMMQDNTNNNVTNNSIY